MSDVKAVPDGFNTVSVYLIVPNAVEAMEFYSKAFGAEIGFRMPGPDGESTMHAEMRLGNSTIMLSDENPQWNMKGPNALGGTPVSVHVYVDDCDAVFNQATEAGCKPMGPMMDMFWGDRFGKVTDPYGHQWSIATHKHDYTPEQMAKGAEQFFKQMADGGCQ